MTTRPVITVISETRPRAASHHCCSICNGMIPRGQKHVRIFYRNDDVVTLDGRAQCFAVRYHFVCPRT